MRATDWSTTRLGPVEHWPQALRTMLGVVLGSRFPMLVWWGPDLLHLYNDAYRPILRDKHPRALAAPAAEIWAEVWDVAGPMARGVQEGGPATWTEDLQLFINSGTITEETYFTFSYSPIPGDDGRVGGLLNTVQETTAKVQGERESRMMHELVARGGDARSERDAYGIVAAVLAANEADLPFTMLYARDDETRAELVASTGWGDYEGIAKPSRVALGDAASWPFGGASGECRVVIDDLARRFGSLPLGRWGGRAETAIVLPLSRAHAAPYGYLIAGVSPHRELDDRYERFFQATADQVMAVIANAQARESETKRAEALAELDRAKTAFFSNVSHEFRTPLTLLLGPVEDCLADTALPAQHRERLELIHHNALRLLKLVTALLDFSRIEAGRMRATYVPTDIAVYTAQLASAFHSTAERANLTLEIDCPPSSEPAHLDREMWEKIVLNLVSNAFKFTFVGGIAVRIRERVGEFELDVQDTGSGIPEHELAHVFERFHRVHGAKARTHDGAGIGLSLVRELVKLHGGDVEVRSTVGVGTTFTVTIPKGSAHLPAADLAPAPAQDEQSASQTSTAFADEAGRWLPERRVEPKASASASRARVLLVDDNADLRAYVGGILAPHYTIDAVADGLEALDVARDRRPDVVLSDVMMPRLDGFGLLRSLRADPDLRDIPFIMLSARAGEEAAVEGFEAGVDDYLVKPFSARELLARVNTHVTLARDRREWTAGLELANKELEAFSYSVSHDLRSPLRRIQGYTQVVLDDYAGKLDDEGRVWLQRIVTGTQRMSALVDDMLKLARINRASLRREQVDLSACATGIIDELRRTDPDRVVDVEVATGLTAHGDKALITIALDNLLRNAWKFTSKRSAARIELGRSQTELGDAFFVRDNGAGFDMTYAAKLFVPFQRLHSPAEFEGTGVGLTTVQRIVARHGGRIWAVATPGAGATFYFTLGEAR